MAASTAGFPLSSCRAPGQDGDGLRRQSSVVSPVFHLWREVVVPCIARDG